MTLTHMVRKVDNNMSRKNMDSQKRVTVKDVKTAARLAVNNSPVFKGLSEQTREYISNAIFNIVLPDLSKDDKD